MIKISGKTDLHPIEAKLMIPVYWHNVEFKSDGNLWYYDIEDFLKDVNYP